MLLNTKRMNNITKKWTNKLNRQFSKEVQIANKLNKKFSEVRMANKYFKSELPTGKCKAKSTVRFHLTPVRMATIKKPNNKCF
jgi:hypothetical protein